MLIYSGHDTTLVPVLSALGLYDGTYILTILLQLLLLFDYFCSSGVVSTETSLCTYFMVFFFSSHFAI